MVEIAFFLVKFVRSFFKIKQSDLLTIGKKPQDHQEPNFSATGTNCHPDCSQKYHYNDLNQKIQEHEEEITQLKELVYMLLPQEKKHLIQIKGESKTILPASKPSKPKNFEVKDLEINVDQFKVYIQVFI